MKRILSALLLLVACCTALAEEKPELTPAEQKAVQENRKKAQIRIREDEKYYTDQERREIGELYKAWNNTPKLNERKTIAQKMLRRYPKSNWTGCIMVVYSNINSKYEEIRLLKQTVRDYNDCFYGNGTQVGAEARRRLVKCLNRVGKKEEAEKYLRELKESYPTATGFNGKFINEQDDDADADVDEN